MWKNAATNLDQKSKIQQQYTDPQYSLPFPLALSHISMYLTIWGNCIDGCIKSFFLKGDSSLYDLIVPRMKEKD